MMKRILPALISRPDSPSKLGMQNTMLSIHNVPYPKWPWLLLAVQVLFLLPLSVPAEDLIGDAAARTCNDGRRTLKLFPVNVLRGAVGVFSPENVRPMLVGTVLAGTGYLLDDEAKSALADEDDVFAKFSGDNMGPAELGVVSLGLFIGGRFSESPRFRAMTYDLSVATTVNAGYTSALKALVNRERPDGSDEDSFPSGHTSNAFMIASVANDHYGKKVGIPAYALASAVGFNRLRSNDHWASDVLAGAALGYIVGRTVVRQNNRPMDNKRNAKSTVSVMPMLAPSFLGVQLGVNF
jgi:membrane-associated phospholipid phosphatase